MVPISFLVGYSKKMFFAAFKIIRGSHPLAKILLSNALVLFLVLSILSIPYFIGIIAIWISLWPTKSDYRSNHLIRISTIIARRVYARSIRSVVQYDPSCFRADPELVYSPLSFGSCIQNELEFSVRINFDQHGLRRSLLKPTSKFQSLAEEDVNNILVLGDSYAMGWGVEDSETFSSLLQRQNVNVFNLGVSSYGTAREFMRLRQWKNKNSNAWRKASLIILQICSNDLDENNLFLKPKASYAEILRKELRSYQASSSSFKSYRLGSGSRKRLQTNSLYKLRYWAPVSSTVFNGLTEIVRIFTSSRLNFAGLADSEFSSDVRPKSDDLANSVYRQIDINKDLIAGKRIIIVTTDGSYSRDRSIYISLLGALPEYNDIFNGSVLVLNPDRYSLPGSYYKIDRHLTPRGHQLISEAVQLYLH